MLLIKTYLDKSPINGIGLFAAEDIKEGTKIYEIDPILTIYVSKYYVRIQSEVVKEFWEKYSWRTGDFYWLSLDNDRFTNHSDNPNTLEKVNHTLASRDIQKGEEITCDYRELGLKIPL